MQIRSKDTLWYFYIRITYKITLKYPSFKLNDKHIFKLIRQHNTLNIRWQQKYNQFWCTLNISWRLSIIRRYYF